MGRNHRSRLRKYMIRIGLLGASRVSRYAVIEPAATVDGIEVHAVAARDAARAASFAKELGIPHAAANYEALIASDTVDLMAGGNIHQGNTGEELSKDSSLHPYLIQCFWSNCAR